MYKSEVHLFECAIDLLSYASLEKMAGRDWRKDNLVSLAGVYLPKEKIEDSTTPVALVKYLNEKPQSKKIFLHFDNDNAGRKASLALKTILPSKYEVIDSPPPCGKDYNDFLCFQIGIRRNKTKERTNERSLSSAFIRSIRIGTTTVSASWDWIPLNDFSTPRRSIPFFTTEFMMESSIAIPLKPSMRNLISIIPLTTKDALFPCRM